MKRVAGCLIAAVALFFALDALFPFPLARLRQQPATVVFDRDGDPMRIILPPDQKFRIAISLDELPAELTLAVLASEDRWFWRHPGVNPVAIARAVLKSPQILILDEATSNLDTESEQLIQASMAALLAGRTTFVIAHRLSTVRRADTILLMEEGRVVERGTHAQLMQARGLYHGMVLRQMESTAQDGEQVLR